MSAYGHSTELKDFDDKGQLRNSAKGSGNIVTFWLEDRIGADNQLSKREMVSIRAPGDKLSEFSGKVTEEIRKEYPREYDFFKRGVDPNIEGTPIQTWTELSLNSRKELMFLGFQTVEQLANATDGQCGGLTNGNVLRRKAQIHIEKTKVVVDVVAENRELKAGMEQLMARLEKLESKDVLPESTAGDGEAPARGKPGRPRKTSD